MCLLSLDVIFFITVISILPKELIMQGEVSYYYFFFNLKLNGHCFLILPTMQFKRQHSQFIFEQLSVLVTYVTNSTIKL